MNFLFGLNIKKKKWHIMLVMIIIIFLINFFLTLYFLKVNLFLLENASQNIWNL